MKLPIITDTHFGARLDSLLFSNYFFRFLDDIFFPLLSSQKYTTILHGGDVHDKRKQINMNTLNRVSNGFFKKLNENNIETHITIGNHDDFYRHTNSLNSVQELFGHHTNLKIYSKPQEVIIDNLKILMMPWINQENQEESLQMIEDSNASVVFGHMPILGFDMFRGQPAHEGLNPQIFKKFDMVLSGHFHHKSTQDNIHFLGSPWEFNFSDYNDPRGFHVLETKTLELEFIQNPYKMFHKLYYDDKGKSLNDVLTSYNLAQYTNSYVKIIVTNKTNPYYFEQLVDKLYKENPADISVIEDLVIDDLGDNDEGFLEEAEDTMSVLLKYVDALDYGGDKNKIKDILRGLYVEANMMEAS